MLQQLIEKLGPKWENWSLLLMALFDQHGRALQAAKRGLSERPFVLWRRAHGNRGARRSNLDPTIWATNVGPVRVKPSTFDGFDTTPSLFLPFRHACTFYSIDRQRCHNWNFPGGPPRSLQVAPRSPQEPPGSTQETPKKPFRKLQVRSQEAIMGL